MNVIISDEDGDGEEMKVVFDYDGDGYDEWVDFVVSFCNGIMNCFMLMMILLVLYLSYNFESIVGFFNCCRGICGLVIR